MVHAPGQWDPAGNLRRFVWAEPRRFAHGFQDPEGPECNFKTYDDGDADLCHAGEWFREDFPPPMSSLFE